MFEVGLDESLKGAHVLIFVLIVLNVTTKDQLLLNGLERVRKEEHTKDEDDQKVGHVFQSLSDHSDQVAELLKDLQIQEHLGPHEESCQTLDSPERLFFDVSAERVDKN